MIDQVETILDTLKSLSNRKTRDEMGSRYGIHTDKAFGVPMAKMLKLSKELGKNHDLAEALWTTGWYEARMVACMVDDPLQVTPAQMDRWCKDFDNWGICDTVCFKLFDQVPHAYSKVKQWAPRKDEFIRRGAFALLACLALHDKKADNQAFLKYLPLIEKAADDDRNFVKKGLLWAMRGIGGRSPELKAEVLSLAHRLAFSSITSAIWLGRNTIRELAKSKK
ncbi:MAG TPA: DNA alkylation repair protein [Gemmatales bacterium]|nr:DNA alkylation repair protein [Gemmatales bacterium]